MATFAGSVRRGLPRVAGGDPWPSGPVEVAEPAPVAEPIPSPVADATATPVAEPTRRAAEATHAVAEPVEAANPEALAPSRNGGLLRRGLPRVPGGEPWPPTSDRLPTPEPQPIAQPGSSRVAAPVEASRPQSVAASVVGPSTSSGTEEASATERSPVSEAEPATGAETEAGAALRRGLPRVPGGEPWPAKSARVAASAEQPVAEPPSPVVEPPSPVAEPAEATKPGSLADAGYDQPTSSDAAAPPPRRQGLPRTTTTPTITPATPAAAPAAASVDLTERAPLPFTRTVWPGAAALTRPEPKPEPRRYGPFTRVQWAGAAIIAGAGLLFAAGMAVLFTRWLLSLEVMQDFLAAYPGEYHLPEGAPVGMPPWLGWQHFFNVFLIVLIIRSGLRVRTEKRPTVFWSPRGSNRRKISLNLWFHQSLDILWVVNGVIFIVLLFLTGQWMKIVPTSWAVFPNALSALLQYVSLDWPTENGWVNYNSLQQLAYFTTVFLAAPLAIATGVRMSGIWPKNAPGLNKAYPVEWARAVHFPVMIYFVLFIIVHVALVFATGALRNLNHMYASQDAENWVGFWIFFASLVVIAAGWIAARPLVLAPIARLFGKVSGR